MYQYNILKLYKVKTYIIFPIKILYIFFGYLQKYPYILLSLRTLDQLFRVLSISQFQEECEQWGYNKSLNMEQ